MNLIKSLFISLFVTFLMAAITLAVVEIVNGGFWLLYTGLLMTTLPIFSMIGIAMIFRGIVRTSPRLTWMMYIGVAGCAVTFAADMNVQDPLPLILSVTSTVGLLLYSFWYSSFNRQSNDKIQQNVELPVFELADQDGKLIPSSTLLARPALLVFYRGNWCPFCVAQIKEISAQYNELEQLGVSVLFVSPQSPKEQAKLGKMFDCNVQFLRDVDNNAATVLGIKHEFAVPAGMQILGYDNDAPLPTLILTDHQGKVIYKNETDNYRVRPEPEVFIAIAKRHLSTVD